MKDAQSNSTQSNNMLARIPSPALNFAHTSSSRKIEKGAEKKPFAKHKDFHFIFFMLHLYFMLVLKTKKIAAQKRYFLCHGGFSSASSFSLPECKF